jgi:chondroitin 4-sulfotransferase 11
MSDPPNKQEEDVKALCEKRYKQWGEMSTQVKLFKQEEEDKMGVISHDVFQLLEQTFQPFIGHQIQPILYAHRILRLIFEYAINTSIYHPEMLSRFHPSRHGFTFILPPFECLWKSDRILIHIPKTAGYSLKVAKKQLKVCSWAHELAISMHVFLRTKSVAFVRNPYDRLVSTYHFIREGAHGTIVNFTSKLRQHFPTFEEWVLSGEFLNIGSLAQVQQTHWLYEVTSGNRLNFTVDFELLIPALSIGRFENLQNDAKRLLGIEELETVNSSTHKHWSHYYSNIKVKKAVYKAYIQDFMAFGYSHHIAAQDSPPFYGPILQYFSIQVITRLRKN